MNLDRMTFRWARAGIISDRVRIEILEFENKWKRQAMRLLIGVLGIPVLLVGFVMAVTVAYMELGPELAFALDLVATSMVAVGCFHVILGKVSARGNAAGLPFSNFMIGSVLLIGAIQMNQLSPYRTLLIWAALILFSSMLAQRFFKWLLSLTAGYVGILYFVREWLGPNPEIDPYLLTALGVAVLTPAVLLVVYIFRMFIRAWKWFWSWSLVKQFIEFLKGELERIRRWWWLTRIRARATSIWMGKVRRFILEVVLGFFIGVGTRKHFELLDAILWQTQTVYLWGTLVIWLVLFTLLPKERYKFSMWFAFFGSLEIFLHMARFSGPEGFRIALEGSTYQTGHLTMGIVVLYVVSGIARKLVWDKKTASELFHLGPLGWLTAVGLIAFV